MGNLFASLISTAGALRAYDRSLSVIQNNVANADTPGFAKQRITFIPQPFDTQRGLSGGVEAGALISSRDSYGERNVWRQTSSFGQYARQSADLEQVEPFFKISKDAGVPGALNKFFNSVSSWSVNPNDPVARQVVLDRASGVARSFNENAVALGEAAGSAEQQIRTTVERINNLTGQVRDFNVERRSDRRKLQDPSLDAGIHATLDQLAELVDFTTIEQADGSLQLLLGGQTPLVIGDRQQKLTADFSFSEARLLNEAGDDITYQVGGGALEGSLDTRNRLIPSYSADLDKLAKAFADRVNQVLAGGVDTSDSTPLVDLFTYDESVGVAGTLKTNPLDPLQLAGAEAGSPGGNGNALKLAALVDSKEVDNVKFHEFYGQLGARVGRDLQKAREGKDVQQQLVNQAKSLRAEQSGVSLDEEAARLVETQRAYQANAQLFAVLNSLTDSLIGLLK